MVLSTATESSPLSTVQALVARTQKPVVMTQVLGTALENQRAVLTARLSAEGRPVAGVKVWFRIGQRLVGTARTDAQGLATLRNVNYGKLDAGFYMGKVAAAFRGNAQYGAIKQRGTLTVSENRATLSDVSGQGVYAGNTTFTTKLNTTKGNTSGRLVRFLVNNETVGTARTNASGIATLTTVLPHALDSGTYVVTAKLDGDSRFLHTRKDGELIIGRSTSNITLANLTHVYGVDSLPTATPSTPGLPVVLSYTDAGGHAVAQPFRAGTYTVTATIDTANYQGSTTGELIITPAPVIVSQITGVDKVYDGTTSAGFDASSAVMTGVLAGDVVALDASLATANFLSRNVGAAVPLTVTGLSLVGADAANYVIAGSGVNAIAGITPRSLTVTGVVANSREYDGTTLATVINASPVVGNAVPGDLVGVDLSGAVGQFDSKDVGILKSVAVTGIVLTGADAGNYTVGPVSTTASISPRLLTAQGLAVASKVYDGTTSATLDSSAAILSNVISGEAVALDSSLAMATFVDKNAGVAKQVNIVGLGLTGADSANYAVLPGTVTGDISQATLAYVGTVPSAFSRTYDGTSAVGMNQGLIIGGVTGVIAGDSVSVDPASGLGVTGQMTDKNAGLAKAVLVSGIALTGADALNYTLAPVYTTVNIYQAQITLNGVSAASKVYDGTTSATLDFSLASISGGIPLDVVSVDTSLAVGSFADKNAGTAKAVSVSGVTLIGTDSANYTLLVAPVQTDILQKLIIATGLSVQDKVYDGTQSATIVTSSPALLGVIVGDDASIDTSSATATFLSAGDPLQSTQVSASITGILVAGADAANYTVSPVVTSATITP